MRSRTPGFLPCPSSYVKEQPKALPVDQKMTLTRQKSPGALTLYFSASTTIVCEPANLCHFVVAAWGIRNIREAASVPFQTGSDHDSSLEELKKTYRQSCQTFPSLGQMGHSSSLDDWERRTWKGLVTNVEGWVEC